MSTNVLNFDERWYFGGKPDTYHGWAITTSGDSMSVGHFKSRKLCRELEKAVKAVLPECIDHVLITACLAIKRFGKEADHQFAEELIKDEFSTEDCVLDEKLEDKLEEIVDGFIER
jgi:hypothetical protein